MMVAWLPIMYTMAAAPGRLRDFRSAVGVGGRFACCDESEVEVPAAFASQRVHVTCKFSRIRSPNVDSKVRRTPTKRAPNCWKQPNIGLQLQEISNEVPILRVHGTITCKYPNGSTYLYSSYTGPKVRT